MRLLKVTQVVAYGVSMIERFSEVLAVALLRCLRNDLIREMEIRLGFVDRLRNVGNFVAGHTLIHVLFEFAEATFEVAVALLQILQFAFSTIASFPLPLARCLVLILTTRLRRRFIVIIVTTTTETVEIRWRRGSVGKPDVEIEELIERHTAPPAATWEAKRSPPEPVSESER